ncbi:MAG TPA: hypothetical protein VGI43_08105 [Mucilaginibacter sp.]|jgi:predicted transcriptional regulator
MEIVTKTEKTALTKFTDAKRRVNRLLSLEKISVADIEDLSKPERDYLEETATQKLEQLTGEERDNFINKIESIVPASTKNQLWEYNQMVISRAISKYMCANGCMPPKTLVAEETGLSRQTVVKHFKEYKTHPEHIASVEQFKFMAPKVLASVFKNAVNGDMKAARLYFEMVGAINERPRTYGVVNEQNNYIQINNTILSQDNLKQLSAEQLNQLESIITNRE